MIKVYHKTATIKAEQFDGSNEMVEKYNITPPMPLDPDYTINTLEGDMVLGVGDWIATSVKGEHWAIADEVFKQTYAELPVIPKYVACWIEKVKSPQYVYSGVFTLLDISLKGMPNDVEHWLNKSTANGDVLVRAWLDGYQVEDDE